MSSLFHGHYKLSDTQSKKLWSSAVVILDTNCLLNMYRYSEAARDDWFRILEKLGDRFVVPYNVAAEFQTNRVGVIKEQRQKFEAVPEALSKEQKTLDDLLDQTWRVAPSEVGEWKSEIAKILNKISARVTEFKEAHSKGPNDDQVRDQLDKIIGDRVFERPNADFEKDVSLKGKLRFENQIPPGFADGKKEESRRYGDLKIWFEIIEYAKKKKRDVIFVTDDAKEDWWLRIKGETVGPRPELREEFRSETGHLFYAFASNHFLKLARENLSSQVRKETISETSAIAKSVIQSLDDQMARSNERLSQQYADFWADLEKKVVFDFKNSIGDSNLSRSALGDLSKQTFTTGDYNELLKILESKVKKTDDK